MYSRAHLGSGSTNQSPWKTQPSGEVKSSRGRFSIPSASENFGRVISSPLSFHFPLPGTGTTWEHMIIVLQYPLSCNTLEASLWYWFLSIFFWGAFLLSVQCSHLLTLPNPSNTFFSLPGFHRLQRRRWAAGLASCPTRCVGLPLGPATRRLAPPHQGPTETHCLQNSGLHYKDILYRLLLESNPCLPLTSSW